MAEMLHIMSQSTAHRFPDLITQGTLLELTIPNKFYSDQ